MNFNTVAKEENDRNKAHIRFHNDGAISVNTEKATYGGVKVKDLNAVGRRKFENIILLQNVDKATSKGLPAVRYH